MADPRLRTLKIKTGVVKRLAKEKTVYEREAEQQKLRIEKYKEQGKDEYDIRKQEEVLNESLMMVPDCQRRLLVAYDELRNILQTEQDLGETEDYATAQKVLEEAKLQLPKAGEFPNRNVVIEVPVVDPRSNALQDLYSQSNDELWVESWLQQNCIYKNIPKVKLKGNSISIDEAQSSLKECLHLIGKLGRTHRDLHDNVEHMSSSEWKQKTIEIGAIKDEFTKLMSKFENHQNLLALKTKLDKRVKKRSRERKRKNFYKQQMEERLETRSKEHKSIDEWLRHKKEDVEKCKMEEDMKKDADCVLSEVTKKKSDARKQLALIASLRKLRFVRDQMATHRGEKCSQEDREAFRINTDKLLKMWENCLRTYATEEQGLKLMLEKTAIEDTRTAQITKERQLLDEWYSVIFGKRQIIPPENTSYWALTAAERDTETFIAIRKSWDTFSVSPNNEMGSKIPIGWLLPDSSENKSWAKYLDIP